MLNETLNLRNFEAMLHAGIIAELERREDIEALKAERVSKGNTANWQLDNYILTHIFFI